MGSLVVHFCLFDKQDKNYNYHNETLSQQLSVENELNVISILQVLPNERCQVWVLLFR